ncbi:MAG: hypothetical protein A3G34_06475 [Candidatus Lindowbacteria bacterium RIFCSPLOWO2_12_FULL_62_27]|nr:MAG: hypothetical protein A3G34_06475 [Candidatus Lindowbacteria bacterium RIFCSPLOWO2_12_FULL_62_27]OGH63726.1 MAG: hypothetical protein A3I06_01125 [Candidatus Lindowbacteria bacterium RIFCSPLOWO2_02_FULL_62_12]
MKLTRTAVSKILARFQNRRVLVVGDFILDHYVWGGVERISPEAPVPVVEVREESYRLGGALNVAANIAALAGRPTAIGVLGEDGFADQVRKQCESIGIVLRASMSLDRPTIRKTRVIAGSQQMVRIDREVRGRPEAETIESMCRSLVEAMKSTDAIVISDYGKGAICQPVLNRLIRHAGRLNLPVVADPKLQNFWSYQKVTLLTPNTKEAGESLGRKLRTQAEIESAGKTIRKKLNLHALLITRGEQGMSLFEPNNRVTHIQTRAREVFDVTGAGDTVTAVCGLALAAGLDLRTGLEIANLAAGIVVGKIGTAVASPKEILEAV